MFLYRFLAVFVQCSDSSLESTVQNYDDLIRTLTSSTKVTVTGSDATGVPSGCAVCTVSAKCQVHMLLKVITGSIECCVLILQLHRFYFFVAQGLIDVEKEVRKLQERTERLQKEQEKLREAQQKPDYESKVPEKVRQEKAKKLEECQEEIAKISEAIKNFLKLQ